MTIKRTPLFGAIGAIAILTLSLTTAHYKNECDELKAVNNTLNTTIAEQTYAINNLQAEKSNLVNQVYELTEQNKKLEQKTTSKQQSTVTSGAGLGKFKITAYCNCSKCCGKWAGGPTASGTMPQAGRTIAVDPKVIPLGSKVIIDGHTYIAEDTGSAIKGNKIDMYFDSHSEAMTWGVKYKNVSLG